MREVVCERLTVEYEEKSSGENRDHIALGLVCLLNEKSVGICVFEYLWQRRAKSAQKRARKICEETELRKKVSNLKCTYVNTLSCLGP